MSAIIKQKIDTSRKTGLVLLFAAVVAFGALGSPAPVRADNPDTWVVIYFASTDRHFGYDTGYFANTSQKAFNDCEVGTHNPPGMSGCGLMLVEKNTCGALVAASVPAYHDQYGDQYGDGFNFAHAPTRDAAVAAAFQNLGHPGDVLVDACSTDGVAHPPPGATAILPPGLNTRAGTQ